MDSQDPSLYCRVCKYALTFGVTSGGVSYLIHANEQRGEAADHAPDPIPLAELPGAIQLCDFCDGTASFVYTVDEEHITHHNTITKRWVNRSDHRDHGPAARTRRAETERTRTDLFGKRHAACPDCAALIEAADLPRLVTRAAETLPPSMLRGNKLSRVRAQLYTNFTHVLAHRQPGRHRITDSIPLGIWEPSPGQQSAGETA